MIILARDAKRPGNLAEYFTIGEAADFLGVSRATLRNWDRQGKLEAVRNPMNRYRLYSHSQLERLLEELAG